MTGRDAKAMGALAESLIWPAVDLVGLVKGGGDRDEIGTLLSGLTDEQCRAFPVILAAMVDDGKTPDELLGWISFDEHGRPLDGPRTVTPRWRTQIGHGTPGMFDRHIEEGSEPCEPCEAAGAARAAAGIERKRLSRQAARRAA